MKIRTKKVTRKEVVRNLVRDAEWKIGFAMDKLSDVQRKGCKADEDMEISLHCTMHDLLEARADLKAALAMLEES